MGQNTDQPELTSKKHQDETTANVAIADKDRVKYLGDELFTLGRMLKAPCFCCGYNSAGYFNPDRHPCAGRHHELYKRT